jgi:hypothetical protein
VALRRATLSPELDFIILPLTSENIAHIWKLVVEKERLAYPSHIIHVQIAVTDRLVFAAYDNFHCDCVFTTDRFPLEALDRLVAKGIIRSYRPDADARPTHVGNTQVPT